MGKPQLRWALSHLLGVIVEDPDGLELRADAAALREARPAVLVGALLELIGDGDIGDRRRAGLHLHVRQEPRVQQQPPDGSEQTQQEDADEQQQDEIRHGLRGQLRRRRTLSTLLRRTNSTPGNTGASVFLEILIFSFVSFFL